MLREQTTKYPKCVTLESPKSSYNALLFRIKENFGEKELDDFEFAFRNDLPKRILEVRKPLKWFSELEQRDKLSPDDLSCLANFLQLVSLTSPLKELSNYQARRRILVFFQKNLEKRIPSIHLETKFNQTWTSEKRLPKHFLSKCQEFISREQCISLKVRRLQCLFSKGLKLLENSCRPGSHDLEVVALKTVYLSDLFFKKFGAMVVKHKDLFKKSVHSCSSACQRRFSVREEHAYQRSVSAGTIKPERPLDGSPESSTPLTGVRRFITTFLMVLLGSLPQLVDWWRKSENDTQQDKK